jgi:hypothetical protein
MNFDFIAQFLGIVDFYDVRYAIFRGKIIHPIVFSILIGTPLMMSACAISAYRKNMRWIKWGILGLFFNYLAFAKLISIKEA